MRITTKYCAGALFLALLVTRLEAQGRGERREGRGETGEGRGGARDSATTKADSTRSRRDSLETVVVRAVRATSAAAPSQHLVTRESLAESYAGQDAPLALMRTPSITAYSDAGGYSGYSYLRLRGIDQTRLNITFDGVPLNDPEDQVLYFSNVPDLLSSAQSVQLQRGVGASTFGTAAYAGSLNIESVGLATARRGGTVALTAGSFGTARMNVEAATGVLPDGWAGYARVTKQHTDGYRRHSGNDSQSAFVSGGWFGDRTSVKLSGLAGVSGTREAYLATLESDLAADRRSNPLTDAEGDRFHQEMANLQFTRVLSPAATFTVSAYRNSAAGAFDVNVGFAPLGGALLDNFFLAHVWYGAIAAFSLREGAFSADIGAHISDYHREHAMSERPALSRRVYDNTGFKQEQSGFAKVGYDLSNVHLSNVHLGSVHLSADLQLRRAAFRYEPTKGSGVESASVDWTFFNPRVGASWRGRGAACALSLSASYGASSREPSRSDLFAGADDVNADNAASILPLTRVKPEEVRDLEVGAAWNGPQVDLGVNLFHMQFRNEIAPIGALSLTGSPLRRNVPSSHRSGVELDAAWRAAPALTLGGNLTLMDATIDIYDDQAAGITRHNVDPLLTPRVLGNASGTWRVSEAFTVSGGSRYVGRSFLGNDSDVKLTLPAAWLADAALAWHGRAVTLRLQVDNALDANAFAGGYHDGQSRYFYPVATRSYLLTSTFTF